MARLIDGHATSRTPTSGMCAGQGTLLAELLAPTYNPKQRSSYIFCHTGDVVRHSRPQINEISCLQLQPAIEPVLTPRNLSIPVPLNIAHMTQSVSGTT